MAVHHNISLLLWMLEGYILKHDLIKPIPTSHFRSPAWSSPTVKTGAASLGTVFLSLSDVATFLVNIIIIDVQIIGVPLRQLKFSTKRHPQSTNLLVLCHPVVGRHFGPAHRALSAARLQLPHALRAEPPVTARAEDGVGGVVDADGARGLLPAAVPSQLQQTSC